MDVLTVDVREIDDHYPEYAEPFEPTGQGRHHGALSWQGGQNGALSWQLRHYGARPWGLAVGLVLILLTALLSRPPVPVPPPGPEPPIIIPEPEPEPEPTPVPPDDPVIPPDEPDEPPEPPVTVRHTVTFVDWDGTLLSSRQYDEGTAASSIVRPATPTRASNGVYTYTFAGWSPAIADVTRDVTYRATYTATPIVARHTVTFVNWDGSLLSRRQYAEGTAASSIVRPATPTRPSDGSYTYTFAGWTPSIRAVTADITYRATYTATPVNAPVQYTVTFVNWNGSQLSSRQYAEGTAASSIVRPATPTRPSDGSYTYTFAGWSPAITAVTANATYTATYTATPVPVQYTVTFENWDGSQISSAKYDEGTPASSIVVPADPTRPSDGSYNYIFIAWTPALADVTADATYTAQYLAEELPTYVSPELALEHALHYYDGWDDYYVDFTATVSLNDVAGASGQLKLRHYNAQEGAWEWTPLSDDSHDMLYGSALIQLYSVKGGVRTELTPSDYNALYDIPEDAEGLEALITWRFPWYEDDEGYILMKIREIMNLSFDYTLPDGTTGTVALSDDFYLYNDWFFGWIEQPQADATEKTITFYYTYDVQYGGPLNYDNLYWHPHLYDHATGEELDMTPTITRVVEDDGTVGDKVVYSFDTLVPGQQFDFTAEVVYSDYGVDDADHWDNWVSTHKTYNPVGFNVEDGRYTITWKDPDGLIIDTTLVDPGETPTHEDPTLWPTDQYTFTFTGWTPDIVPATENATYTAQCTKTLRQYPVVFVDEDGSTILKDETWYDYGTSASDIVQPATPTKPSDATYDYTFAGWDPELEDVTWDATYTATYTATPVPVQYTVTFVNWDSSVISSAKYDEGTPASSIVVPADPTRPSDGSYKYIFNGWTPSLEPVTADATYTAVYLAEELPTYDLPEVDIEHEIYYDEYADEYFADFTASVTLKDVAGCTGQLKLMHYDDFTDAWEWAEFTGEDGVSYGNYYVLVKLYTVKDGVRTEFTPSDLNAPYDIPDDAEGLEADISWWFPWYVDDDDNFLPRVRETLNLEFDYTLPNGESGTVSLENDFHLYKDWFFGWDDTAVLDETAKTITIEVPYQVDYGGPLNYDNVYWHCHLYWQPEDDYHWNEKGTELEITPTVTTVTREDGTVAARIVYTLDEVVPGRLYDFYADVIYSDYGVDDADYWNNWVETYDATHMSF